MFSVYGASGRLFRGTLEQLRQIGPVPAVDRLRSLEPAAHDGSAARLPPGPSAPGGHPHHDVHRDVLSAYAPSVEPPGRRWGHQLAGAVMSRHVLVLRDTDTEDRAWRQLEQHGYGQAPVVNAGGTLVGMVTLPGLAKRRAGSLFGERSAQAAQSLATCMLTPVPSVAAAADLRRVAGLLLESALPALAVVDEAGHVEGLVSRSDILRAVLDDTVVDQWG